MLNRNALKPLYPGAPLAHQDYSRTHSLLAAPMAMDFLAKGLDMERADSRLTERVLYYEDGIGLTQDGHIDGLANATDPTRSADATLLFVRNKTTNTRKLQVSTSFDYMTEDDHSAWTDAIPAAEGTYVALILRPVNARRMHRVTIGTGTRYAWQGHLQQRGGAGRTLPSMSTMLSLWSALFKSHWVR